MPTVDEYLAAAASAAPAFGIVDAQVSLLSHSENVVCELKAPTGERFVLRLHRPGYNTANELASEVRFVDSLRRFGVPTPEPVPAEAGEFYVVADVAGISHQVGVISWVDGAPIGAPVDNDEVDGTRVVGHYRTIGTLAAQIRSHSATWQPSDGFERRRWDADGLMGPNPLWGRFWEIDRLSDAQRSLFAAGRERLYETLAALPTTPDHFGLIHSDLHLGNVMADGDDLTVIDFDDSGYGWFVHELAVSLHPVLGEPFEAAAREAIVAGYRTVHALSAAEEELIDTFLAVRWLMIVGWLAARPEVPIYERFDDLVGLAEDHIAAFMAS